MLSSRLTEYRSIVLRDEPLFVVPEFQFPLAAVQRLAHARRDAERCGQLTCLMGPRGSGKSHLARHAVRLAVQLQPRLRWGWLTAVEWRDALTEATRTGQLPELLHECGRLQLVVCEDLDRALDDPPTGDLLVGWLDALRSRDVRVLITSSQSTGQLDRLPPRLISRLHSGLTARIAPLSDASRQDFWQQLTATKPLRIPREAWTLISRQTETTALSLVSAWNRIEQGQRRETVPPTLANIERWLEAPVEAPTLTLAEIAQDVAEAFQVTLTGLRSESRQQALLLPRQCAMYLAREVARWPLEAIGNYFGHRTHTSVSHSCKRLKELVDRSPTLREQVQRLAEQLRTRCG
ncbi:MAG TPA: helix-turn-helix domain-containing protein [Planctomycetaceae bacterium]|nr:helix-turn-helix domain-containing protein [Planctomycetaceae bacterium]